MTVQRAIMRERNVAFVFGRFKQKEGSWWVKSSRSCVLLYVPAPAFVVSLALPNFVRRLVHSKGSGGHRVCSRGKASS